MSYSLEYNTNCTYLFPYKLMPDCAPAAKFTKSIHVPANNNTFLIFSMFMALAKTFHGVVQLVVGSNSSPSWLVNVLACSHTPPQTVGCNFRIRFNWHSHWNVCYTNRVLTVSRRCKLDVRELHRLNGTKEMVSITSVRFGGVRETVRTIIGTKPVLVVRVTTVTTTYDANWW